MTGMGCRYRKPPTVYACDLAEAPHEIWRHRDIDMETNRKAGNVQIKYVI
jgi:hypothetical protein